MQTQHLVSSDSKPTTGAFKPSRQMVATAIVGAAVIGFLVHKTPGARERLEDLASMARVLGGLTEHDSAIVAKLLAQPSATAVKGATQ